MPAISEPGPLLLLNAPMMGSGKSLLAKVLDATHQGQLSARRSPPTRRNWPNASCPCWTRPPRRSSCSTTAPIRSAPPPSPEPSPPTRSPSASWGKSEDHVLSTRRLWSVTGNNLQLAGDMARRGLWVTIDPGMPQPWTRTGFHYTDLPGWIREHRGEVLAAMLTLARAWVAAGDAAAGDTHRLNGLLVLHAQRCARHGGANRPRGDHETRHGNRGSWKTTSWESYSTRSGQSSTTARSAR